MNLLRRWIRTLADPALRADYNDAVATREAAKSALAASQMQRGKLLVELTSSDDARKVLFDGLLAERSAHIDTKRRLEKELVEATTEFHRQAAELKRLNDQLRDRDAEHADLSGQLQDARQRLNSYELAEAITDETRAKRHHDGQGIE